MNVKDTKPKWDGKSRVSTDMYRKNFDSIFKKIKAKKNGSNEWVKGYNKWKKNNEKI